MVMATSQDASTNIVAELTLEALQEHGAAALPGYSSCLRAACAETPPPFGMAWYGERYREVAADPSWLARSLIDNAVKEAEGSRKLWALSGRTGDSAVAELVRQHAIDEARHARYYIFMLQVTFPEAVDRALLSELEGVSPGYRSQDHPPRTEPFAPDQAVLDELIQMNIGEIRTRIHQLLLRPVILAHCPGAGRTRLQRVMDTLLVDETCHIEYTARLIERAIASGAEHFVASRMQRRLAEFNQITLEEVGAAKFEGA